MQEIDLKLARYLWMELVLNSSLAPFFLGPFFFEFEPGPLSHELGGVMTRANLERLVTALFGVFFIIIAVVVLIVAWDATPIGGMVVSLVIGFLGAEAIVSAWRDRSSLLSRMGPLP